MNKKILGKTGLEVTELCFGDIKEENELLKELHRNNVYVAMRFTSNVGGIRVSCHFFNNRSDIDALIAQLKKAYNKKKPDFKA